MVSVDAAGVVVEVLVHAEAGRHRPHPRQVLLHPGDRRLAGPAAEAGQPGLPVRPASAGLVVLGVGEVRLVGHPVLHRRQGVVGPPAAAGARTGPVVGTEAEERVRLGEVDRQRRFRRPDPHHRLQHRDRAEGHARAAAGLVADRRDIAVARPVTPVDVRRGSGAGDAGDPRLGDECAGGPLAQREGGRPAGRRGPQPGPGGERGQVARGGLAGPPAEAGVVHRPAQGREVDGHGHDDPPVRTTRARVT